MCNLFEPFRRWFRRDAHMSPNGHMAVSVPKIMHQLAATQPVELSCDEVLRLMGACAEAVMRGEDYAQVVPLFEKHVDMCPDCREEFEALLRILRAQQA
jgi:hypothetical protein